MKCLIEISVALQKERLKVLSHLRSHLAYYAEDAREFPLTCMHARQNCSVFADIGEICGSLFGKGGRSYDKATIENIKQTSLFYLKSRVTTKTGMVQDIPNTFDQNQCWRREEDLA